MSDTKQTAADIAFEQWLNSSPVRKPSYLNCWHAAWTARGVADIAAVEGERLEHDSPQCIKSGTDDCSDCAYHQALDDGKNAIRALDGDG